MGLPRTQNVRSISKLGLSMVTVVFDDSVNTYFARQLVNERLQEVRARLPEGLEPRLGPVATAFGEVYQYTIEGGGTVGDGSEDAARLADQHQLRTVPGVNEVNTWGGRAKQYQIEVDPVRCRPTASRLRDVFERIRENNANFGGGFIEHASEQYTVRGLGRTGGIADLAQHRGQGARGHAGHAARRRHQSPIGPCRARAPSSATARAKPSPAWSSCSRAKTATT